MFDQPSIPKANLLDYFGYAPPATDRLGRTFNKGEVFAVREVIYSGVNIKKPEIVDEGVKTHEGVLKKAGEVENLGVLAAKLTTEHPEISVYKGIFGGIPHIKDVRLSVGDILAQLYVLESIDAVVEYYSHDITKEQVKKAIAYAQDFLEMASESQTYG